MVYTKTVWVASTAPGISATNLNNLETQYDSAVVIGEIKLYSGTAAPTNFFLCNGTSKSNITYAALYAITGYKFGGSSTWFNLPNLMGKFIAGYSTDVGSTYGTIGGTGGSSDVTLTSSQMPAHTHDIITGNPAGGYTDFLQKNSLGDALVNSNSAGEDAAHENRPPYVVLNYIIRYQ